MAPTAGAINFRINRTKSIAKTLSRQCQYPPLSARTIAHNYFSFFFSFKLQAIGQTAAV